MRKIVMNLRTERHSKELHQNTSLEQRTVMNLRYHAGLNLVFVWLTYRFTTTEHTPLNYLAGLFGELSVECSVT